MSDLEAEFLGVIHALNTCVWRNRVDAHTIEEWLREFGVDGQPGSNGRIHALYLLSRFMYFGDAEVRALLRALYRDHFRYPLVARIRRQEGDTRDETRIRAGFERMLARTRFLGIGNPSDSGTHLLYHYRQENDLTTRQFISTHEILDLTQNTPALADPEIERYVFIDDFCGSGKQAVRYSKQLLQPIADAADRAGVKATFAYHVLLGSEKGLNRVRGKTRFNEVECVLELDESFRAFSDQSRYFCRPPQGIRREAAHLLARHYGQQLVGNSEALGFAKGQLMLGFVHNTPNNTLPIFWHPGDEGRTWHPVFRRYGKDRSPLKLTDGE